MTSTKDTATFVRGLDRLVEQRYGPAVRRADEARRADPSATPDELAAAVIRATTRELAAVAAVSGGVAAVPGWGTAVALGALTADTAWTMGRLSELVLTLGIIYGHDSTSIEERKTWVLSVLAMANGAVSGLDGVAARVGGRGGALALARLSDAQQSGVSSKLATRLLTRLATEKALSRLGRLVPFGIGAGVGAAGNALITRSVGRAALEFFGTDDDEQRPTTPRRLDPRRLSRERAGGRDLVIDAEATPQVRPRWSPDAAAPNEATTTSTTHR